MKYYVYYLIDPKTNLPFYVGKGCGDRMYQHMKKTKAGKDMKNPHKYNKIQQILGEGLQIKYLKIYNTDNEEEAYQKETEEVAQLKNMGMKLCNIQPGGCGGNGIFSNPIERGKNISKALRGRKISELHYTAMKPVWEKNKVTFLGTKRSDATKKILSLQKMGDKNPAKREDVRKKIANTIIESGCCNGENNPNALFSQEIVNSIRKDWNDTIFTTKELANKYRCSPHTIRAIISNDHYYDPNWIRKFR